MEEREFKTFTEEELLAKVKEASYDFLFKTRSLTSNPIPYESWLKLMEQFVIENMNVVVSGMVEKSSVNKHFRYQHSYWTQHRDCLLELDGIRYLTLTDTERENLFVKVSSMSWEVDDFPSHGTMLKICIVFKKNR